jgi:PadR family transcriptional regulator PadR
MLRPGLATNPTPVCFSLETQKPCDKIAWLYLRKNVYHGKRLYGSLSTIMTKTPSDRVELLQGTLDMLILRTLLLGPAHGHEIAKHIQRTSDEVLQIEHGSLYPALHRLERKGWLNAKWETAKDRNRQFKYYRLTPAGKKQLAAEQSKWKQMAGAITRVMSPA